ALSQVRRLSAWALRDLLASERDRGGLCLVDVREPHEFNTGHLHGAHNIPLADLARRLGELEGGRTAVFLCRSGRRSLMACALALRSGMKAPAHLEGGLLAWVAEVDPALEVAAG
ncbi:MAG: rhodanese-like domain-containing protein, partial [Steroidobacteraceae bacterium]